MDLPLGYPVADGEEGTFGSHQKILFNPFDSVLQGGESIYLIADDYENAASVGNYEFINRRPFATNFENPNHSEAMSPFWHLSEIKAYAERRMKSSRTTRFDITSDLRISLSSLEEVPRVLPVGSSFSIKGKTTLSREFNVLSSKKVYTAHKGNVEAEAPSADEVLGSSSSSSSFGEGLKSPPAIIEVVLPWSPSVESSHDVIPEDMSFIMGKTLPASITNHILYCSLSEIFPPNLAYFIAPIRQKDALIPIVILCECPPVDEEWILISGYNHVYYISGTPLLRKDLRKAMVEKSSRTIVFTNPDQDNVSDRSADAPSLLSLLNIQAMSIASTNFVMVEFIHSQNMKLIGDSRPLRSRSASDVTELQIENIIPAFIGGHLFTQTMFHSILCQAYYEDNLLIVLKVLV